MNVGDLITGHANKAYVTLWPDDPLADGIHLTSPIVAFAVVIVSKSVSSTWAIDHLFVLSAAGAGWVVGGGFNTVPGKEG